MKQLQRQIWERVSETASDHFRRNYFSSNSNISPTDSVLHAMRIHKVHLTAVGVHEEVVEPERCNARWHDDGGLGCDRIAEVKVWPTKKCLEMYPGSFEGSRTPKEGADACSQHAGNLVDPEDAERRGLWTTENPQR